MTQVKFENGKFWINGKEIINKELLPLFRQRTENWFRDATFNFRKLENGEIFQLPDNLEIEERGMTTGKKFIFLKGKVIANYTALEECQPGCKAFKQELERIKNENEQNEKSEIQWADTALGYAEEIEKLKAENTQLRKSIEKEVEIKRMIDLLLKEVETSIDEKGVSQCLTLNREEKIELIDLIIKYRPNHPANEGFEWLKSKI